MFQYNPVTISNNHCPINCRTNQDNDKEGHSASSLIGHTHVSLSRWPSLQSIYCCHPCGCRQLPNIIGRADLIKHMLYKNRRNSYYLKVIIFLRVYCLIFVNWPKIVYPQTLVIYTISTLYHICAKIETVSTNIKFYALSHNHRKVHWQLIATLR